MNVSSKDNAFLQPIIFSIQNLSGPMDAFFIYKKKMHVCDRGQ